ncbi:MAG: hypothetical protein ACFFD4_11250 [Candidatus Odinarchaeota archaeon]
METQQKIKLLESELISLEEEKSRMELVHLDTKIRLSNRLRELMKYQDDLKSGKKPHSSLQPSRAADQAVLQQMQRSLMVEKEQIARLEAEEKRLTGEISSTKQEVALITEKITSFTEELAKTSSKLSQQSINKKMEEEVRKKQEELENVKSEIVSLGKNISLLQSKNTDLDKKVTAAKRVVEIIQRVDSFKSGAYVKLEPYEEQARTLWEESLDTWYDATNHFTGRDPLFFSESYRAFEKAVKSFYILFKGEVLDEEDDFPLEDILNYLYRCGFSIPSHLVDNIRNIAGKIEMGQDVIPLPPFWDKVFDFLKKNMKQLRIEDPAVEHL